MRIALVTPHAAPPGTYATCDRGPRVVPLAQALAQLGHEVTVYARRDSPSLPARLSMGEGVSIEHLPAGPAARIKADDLAPHIRAFGEHLARRWRRSTPDVVHAYSWPSGLAALAGTQDLGVPVVQTFHSLAGPDGGRFRQRPSHDQLARARLKVCLARSVHGVLARSSEEMRQLAALGVPRGSIQVVPWGVDTAHFTPDGPAAQRNGQARLLTVWPNGGQQGLELLVRALCDLPKAELLVTGGPTRGQLARDKLFRDITRLASRLGVADRLVFTGGLSWQELPPLLRSADVAVSASLEGLFDPAALQAMACGTPVAAPAAGFYPDAVIDGTTGILVPPGRPGLLARRIRRLLASPLQLDASGIAAADRARSRYSWDRIARETVQAYQRFLPRPVEPEEQMELEEEPELELADAVV